MIESVKVVKVQEPKVYFHIRDDVTEEDIKNMVFFILDASNGKTKIQNCFIYIYYEFEKEEDFKEIDLFVLEMIKEIGEVIREEQEDIIVSWVPTFSVKVKEIDMKLKRAYYEVFLKWEIAGIAQKEN